MTQFSVSAWFLFDVDIPGKEGTDEYNEVIEKITEEIESSNATLVFKFDQYHQYFNDEVRVEWVD